MADYSGESMQRLNALAMAEAPNASVVQNAAKLWAELPPALFNVRDALRHGTDEVCGCWEDRTRDAAFLAPVEEGMASIEKSGQAIAQAKPAEQLQILSEQIGITSQQVPELAQAYMELEQLAKAFPMLAPLLLPIMEQLRMQAASLMNTLGQAYNTSAGAVQGAAQGHSWNGPQAGAPPSVSADSGNAGSARYATASTPPGSGPSAASFASVTGPGEVAASASPGGQASTGQVGSGDTGLAGTGVATAPVPPAAGTVPPAGGTAPVPPTTGTPPVGAPVAGVPVAGAAAAARVLPVATVGTVARGQSPIPQAAKVPNGITAASSGPAPTNAELTTGSGAAKGSRSTTPAFPVGAGVPAALSPLAMSNLQGLIRRLKPIVTQHGTAPAERPATVPGVPKGLRGRTAHTDDDNGFPALPSNGTRLRHGSGKDAVPETVQLLDEEIWQVEQANASTEKVPAHR